MPFRVGGCFLSDGKPGRLFVLIVVYGAVAAGRGQLGHQAVGVAARHVELVFVDVDDFHEIAPFRGVDPHPLEAPQVDEMAVVAEEAEPAGNTGTIHFM